METQTLVETVEKVELTPGSSGWTCADLDRPGLERQWHERRVELVHGVISAMGSPLFAHAEPLSNLSFELKLYFRDRGFDAKVGVGEVDLQVSATTRYKADGIVLMPEDVLRQTREQSLKRPRDHALGVIIVPPTVVIESISLGHETSDRIEKFRDYAGFGVANYWIVDAYRKTLEGWQLRDGVYEVDFTGASGDTVEPAVFPGLGLAVAKIVG